MGMAQRKMEETHLPTGRPKLNIHEPHVLVKRSKSRNKRIRSIVLLGLLMSTLIILVLIRYTVITQINNEITANKGTMTLLKVDQDYLTMQLEPYQTPDRVERLARLNLGMDYPKRDQYIALENGPKIIAATETKGLGSYLQSLLLGMIR